MERAELLERAEAAAAAPAGADATATATATPGQPDAEVPTAGPSDEFSGAAKYAERLRSGEGGEPEDVDADDAVAVDGPARPKSDFVDDAASDDPDDVDYTPGVSCRCRG